MNGHGVFNLDGGFAEYVGSFLPVLSGEEAN